MRLLLDVLVVFADKNYSLEMRAETGDFANVGIRKLFFGGIIQNDSKAALRESSCNPCHCSALLTFKVIYSFSFQCSCDDETR